MAKPNIGFDSWPFEKGEKAKLMSFSKPYLDMGQWYVDAGYLSVVTNKAKFIKHFLGDVHLLVAGANYIDGIRQDMPNWETAEISLTANVMATKKIEARLIENKKDNRFNYYTFGIGYNKEYYIIPLAEIVRVILAPDIFWLNQMTLLDSIDTRILYDHDGDVLNLNFSTDVPVRYVKMDTKIKHMAWLFSNPMIYNMINQLYHNIQSGNGILFDFLFKELEITIKFEKWNDKNYVREIIACKGKKILCSEIIVHHPGVVEYEEDDNNSGDDGQCKRRTPLGDDDGVKSLVSNLAATPNTIDVAQDDSMQYEYSSVVKIERVKTARSGSTSKMAQTQVDNDAGSNKRTTADAGGLETAPQLEFEHKISEKLEGVFADMLAVLRLMKERAEVRSIGYHIGELNDHFKGRSVCTLDDGLTPRKYLVGQIKLADSKEAILIEVEKAILTTRMFVSDVSQDWNLICDKIIKGFIEKSGSWPDIGDFDFKELEVNKFKHTNADVIQKEKRIFQSLEK